MAAVGVLIPTTRLPSQRDHGQVMASMLAINASPGHQFFYQMLFGRIMIHAPDRNRPINAIELAFRFLEVMNDCSELPNPSPREMARIIRCMSPDDPVFAQAAEDALMGILTGNLTLKQFYERQAAR